MKYPFVPCDRGLLVESDLSSCFCNLGCVDVGGQCASNPCPIGYQCSKSPNGYQCTCVDSSKCDLAKAGCKDTTCKYGMKYFS